MRIRTTITALAAAAVLALSGCTAEDTDPAPAAPAASQDNAPKQDSTPTEEAPATEDEPAAEPEPQTATLPDLVGQDLQGAQDEAQGAGFYVLDDQDASGQNRLQVLDRNWIVCSQEPEPGTHPTDTPVTLHAVKDGEAC